MRSIPGAMLVALLLGAACTDAAPVHCLYDCQCPTGSCVNRRCQDAPQLPRVGICGPDGDCVCRGDGLRCDGTCCTRSDGTIVTAHERECIPDPPTTCDSCPDGKTCCPSLFQPDRPHCVDLQLNKEHCGSCGVQCRWSCFDGQCVDATCAADMACPWPTSCNQGGFCCPPGTTFMSRIADFMGCCPDGDFCGCSDEFGAYCPISRRSAKTDIHYLTPADATAARSRLLSTTPVDEPVDLYGYTSLTVVALQAQQLELDELRRQVEELRRLASSAAHEPRSMRRR